MTHEAQPQIPEPQGGHPLVVRLTVLVASVLAGVSGSPPETSCRKNCIPWLTHFPVGALKEGPVEANSDPLAEPTLTCTFVVPVDCHESVVTPNPRLATLGSPTDTL